MEMIDLHEDLQIFLKNPHDLGYEEVGPVTNFDKHVEKRHADIPAYRKVGMKVIFVSVFPFEKKEGKWLGQNFQHISEQIAFYRQFVSRHKDCFSIVTDKASLEKTVDQQKIGLVIHMEGLGAVEDPQVIDLLAELGVRSVGLCWNSPNNLCSTCRDAADNGLSQKGKAVVEAIIKNNLILDLSHTSFKTQDQVLAMEGVKKVVFSHGGINEVFPFEQNVRLEIANKIKKLGGLVGLTFLDLMIGGKNKTKVKDFMDHLAFVQKNGLEDQVCLGTDFFGFEFGRGLKEVKNLTDCQKLFEQVSKTFGSVFAEKLFCGNAKQFLFNSL